MNKNISAIFAVACLAMTSTPQAWAASSGGDEFPEKAAGFVVGSVVGTPICMVRRFMRREVELSRALSCNSNNLLFLVPCGLVSIPVAAFGGAVEGPGYSIHNAFAAETPFSKDQFSLGEMQN